MEIPNSACVDGVLITALFDLTNMGHSTVGTTKTEDGTETKTRSKNKKNSNANTSHCEKHGETEPTTKKKTKTPISKQKPKRKNEKIKGNDGVNQMKQRTTTKTSKLKR